MKKNIIPKIGEVIDQVQVKGWYASKSVWLNVLVLVVDAIHYFATTKGASFTVDAASLEHLAVAGAAVAGLGVRFATRRPVGIKKTRETVGDRLSL